MEQIDALQGRIQAALDRIGSGVLALEDKYAGLVAPDDIPEPEPVPLTGDAALMEALEDEKTANAQLEARNTQLHERLSEMEKKVAAVDKVDDVIAMEAELELLRNEVANASKSSPAADALLLEVARLKSELETAQNIAANAEEKYEVQIASLTSRVELFESGSANPDTGAEASAQLQAELDLKQAEIDRLTSALAEAEAREQAQLDQPVPQETPAAEAEDGLNAGLDGRLVELDASLQTLQKANDALTKSNAALRGAISEGLGDAGLINQGLEAEIEALRAGRAADQAEINTILARLEPLLPPVQTPAEAEPALEGDLN